MKRRAQQLLVIALSALCTVIALLVLLFSMKNPGAPEWLGLADKLTATSATPVAHQEAAKAREVEVRFREAVVMLHAKQYEHALTALHRVLELAPTMPEAHVNMGYTMLGLKRFAAARDFFSGAVELRPMQANAYYGLALALDEQKDRAGAIGAMRSFVHLAKPDDPFVRKARSALWEWQSTGDGGPVSRAETIREPKPLRASRDKTK